MSDEGEKESKAHILNAVGHRMVVSCRLFRPSKTGTIIHFQAFLSLYKSRWRFATRDILCNIRNAEVKQQWSFFQPLMVSAWCWTRWRLTYNATDMHGTTPTHYPPASTKCPCSISECSLKAGYLHGKGHQLIVQEAHSTKAGISELWILMSIHPHRFQMVFVLVHVSFLPDGLLACSNFRLKSRGKHQLPSTAPPAPMWVRGTLLSPERRFCFSHWSWQNVHLKVLYMMTVLSLNTWGFLCLFKEWPSLQKTKEWTHLLENHSYGWEIHAHFYLLM